jgi:hypothetical protein
MAQPWVRADNTLPKGSQNRAPQTIFLTEPSPYTNWNMKMKTVSETITINMIRSMLINFSSIVSLNRYQLDQLTDASYKRFCRGPPRGIVHETAQAAESPSDNAKTLFIYSAKQEVDHYYGDCDDYSYNQHHHIKCRPNRF